MTEHDMRRAVLDLVLWAEPDKLQTIWSFVRSYLRGEIVGVRADADYLIEHGKFLQAERRRKEARRVQQIGPAGKTEGQVTWIDVRKCKYGSPGMRVEVNLIYGEGVSE